MPAPQFELGRTLATPAVLAAFERNGESPLIYLSRHYHLDPGELDEHDQRANQEAVENGNRILSSYKLRDGTKVWIITEADRASTTLLLPSEY